MKGHLLALTYLLAYTINAQNFMRPNEWKKYRKEVFVSIGSANFLGDLGGRNKAGADYSPADLDFSQTKTAFGIGGRYKLDKMFCVVAKFSYLIVSGDDALTHEPARNNRNLNFKSNIFELTVRAEGGYQSKKQGTSRYGIRQSYGNLKNMTHNLYGFIGIGAFYFNPKGRAPDGKYVDLYPLHTEGQGLPGGPKQYSRFSISIPIGGYYKLTINKKWAIGIEFCYRKTFTDYIDDVGSTYYDPASLEAAYGPLSRQMSDPNLGTIAGATKPDGNGQPAQRGDSQKDTYVTLELTAGYIFKKQKKSARLRSKF